MSVTTKIKMPEALREKIEDDGIEITGAEKVKDADDEGDGEEWEVEERKYVYEVRQDYDGNQGDPIMREEFDTLEEAKSELDSLEAPESWMTVTTEHYAFIEKVTKKRTAKYEFYSSWDNFDNDKWEHEDSEDTGDMKSFGTREGDTSELIHTCHYNLSNDVSGEYETNGVTVTISGKARKGEYTSKYSSLWIQDKDENDIGRIELRIADHSYNPANRSMLEDGFISVVIANKDETAGRFSGAHNLYFDGDNEYEEIVEQVKEKIQDILDGLDIKERIQAEGKSMAKGGTVGTKKHATIGTLKEVELFGNIKDHDMAAICGGCKKEFTYSSKRTKTTIWECPYCKSRNTIV